MDTFPGFSIFATIVLVVACYAVYSLIYALCIELWTFVFGTTRCVLVVQKQVVVTSDGQGKRQRSYVVLLEHEDRMSVLYPGKRLFGRLIEGKSYLVKGLLWEDNEFTTVGRWGSVIVDVKM